MSEQIARDLIKNVDGEWSVSTIRTDAGGAPANRSLGDPFSSADFKDETPWPFETMVFKGGATGYYHEPHSSKKVALERHDIICRELAAGVLEIGKGVTGDWGVPSTTPEEWRSRKRANRNHLATNTR